MDPLLGELSKAVIVVRRGLASSMRDHVDEFLEDLHDATKDLDSKTFRANLNCRKPQLNSMFKNVETALKDIRDRMRERLTEDNNGSFFPKAMEKHYTAAARAKKSVQMTLTESRLQNLSDGVSGIDGPYTVIHTKLLSIWEDMKQNCLKTGKEAVAKNLEGIEALYRKLSTPELQDNTTTTIRADLQRSVMEGKKQHRGVILASLRECGLHPRLESVRR